MVGSLLGGVRTSLEIKKSLLGEVWGSLEIVKNKAFVISKIKIKEIFKKVNYSISTN
jgi:hypothetical protein